MMRTQEINHLGFNFDPVPLYPLFANVAIVVFSALMSAAPH